MKIITVFSLSLIALIATALFWLSSLETNLLRKAYGLEAIKALALDAASAFPTKEADIGGHQYWPRSVTPCVFTTNVVEVLGNGSRVSWDNWPSGDVPSCRDFYAPEAGTYDPKTTIPMNCLPAMTVHNSGGPPLSFLAAVVNEANTDALMMAKLSSERRNKLAKLGSPTNYYYTNNFIRGGGLDGVLVELVETKVCDGFKLFRFQTEVERPKNMRPNLEANGYWVGLK